jgi:hypothetical protein
MVRKHSKNAGVMGSEGFTYHERKAMGFGTVQQRLGKASSSHWQIGVLAYLVPDPEGVLAHHCCLWHVMLVAACNTLKACDTCPVSWQDSMGNYYDCCLTLQPAVVRVDIGADCLGVRARLPNAVCGASTMLPLRAWMVGSLYYAEEPGTGAHAWRLLAPCSSLSLSLSHRDNRDWWLLAHAWPAWRPSPCHGREGAPPYLVAPPQHLTIQTIQTSRGASCLPRRASQDPVVTPHGYVYSRQAIVENLLAQKKAIRKKLAAWEAAQEDDKRKVRGWGCERGGALAAAMKLLFPALTCLELLFSSLPP